MQHFNLLKGALLTFIMLFLISAVKSQTCTSTNMVINENFNQYSGALQNYSETMMKSDFGSTNGPYKGLDGKTKVGNSEVRAFFPQGSLGGWESGYTWFSNLPNGGVDEAIMEYKFKFSAGYDWTLGGKLPGLSGGTSPRGCNEDVNVRENGFSARIMWKKGGKMITYPYWHEMSGRCGENWYWKNNNGTGSDVVMQTNRWYTVKQRVKMNTPGQRNGIVEVYLDGQLVQRETNVMWRKSGKYFNIDYAYMTTYVGGSTKDFRPSQNQYIYFDDVKVWTNCSSVGGGTTPPPPPVTGIVPNNDIYTEGSTVFNTQELRVENSTTRVRKSYLKFNLSELAGTVTSAKLSLKATSLESGSGTVNVYLGSHDNWSETSTGSLPAQGTLLGSYTGTVAVNQVVDVNLTGLPIGEDVSLVVYMNSGGNDVAFISSEGATPPQLHIVTNDPPSVSFTNPSSSSLTVTEGYSLSALVAASDQDGTISNVKLYRNNVLIRQDETSPYEWGKTGTTSANELNGLTAGTYVFKAVATDNSGGTSQDQFKLTVQPAAGIAPSVSFTTPSGNLTLQQGYTSLTVVASASDADGTISKVDLFIDNALVRTEGTAPYEWGHAGSNYTTELLGLTAGTYVVKAVATDNNGLTASTQFTLTVTAPNDGISISFTTPETSTLTVQEGYSLIANVDAWDADGTISKVELFRNNVLIRKETVTPYDWGHANSPNPAELNGLSAGTYVFKAVATDNENNTAETTFTLIVTSATSGGGNASVRLQYMVGDAGASTDNAIRPYFKLYNDGTSDINYSNLKVRYWFTAEGTGTPTFSADYATFGAENLTGNIVSAGNGNYYMEVGFTSGAGILEAGTNSGNIKVRSNYSNWSNHDETNDYSYTATQTAYANYSKITVYQNNILIWGTPPSYGARLMNAGQTLSAQPDKMLKIYPNPAQQSFVIEAPEGEATVYIYNLTGSLIYQNTMNGKLRVERTSRFAAGLYVVKVQDATGTVRSHKLILE